MRSGSINWVSSACLALLVAAACGDDASGSGSSDGSDGSDGAETGNESGGAGDSDGGPDDSGGSESSTSGGGGDGDGDGTDGHSTSGGHDTGGTEGGSGPGDTEGSTGGGATGGGMTDTAATEGGGSTGEDGTTGGGTTGEDMSTGGVGESTGGEGTTGESATGEDTAGAQTGGEGTTGEDATGGDGTAGGEGTGTTGGVSSGSGGDSDSDGGQPDEPSCDDLPLTHFVGSLAQTRFVHVAESLPDGRVLMAGGHSSGFLDSVEIYDPNDESFEPGPPLPAARRRHGILLQDERILVVGDHDNPTSDFPGQPGFLFDPVTEEWITTGQPYVSRWGAQLSMLSSGQVLYTAGYDGHSVGSTWDTAEIYDPNANTWTRVGDLGERRVSHTSTTLMDGRVLVAGGTIRTSLVSSATSEIYDPQTQSFTYGDTMGDARARHTATDLGDGRVLIVGGRTDVGGELASTEVFGEEDALFYAVADLHEPRSLHTATWIGEAGVAVVGGLMSDQGGVRTGSRFIELFDPASETWTPVACIQTARFGHTATLLPDGSVLIAGGRDMNATPLGTVEVWAPDFDPVG